MESLKTKQCLAYSWYLYLLNELYTILEYYMCGNTITKSQAIKKIKVGLYLRGREDNI